MPVSGVTLDTGSREWARLPKKLRDCLPMSWYSRPLPKLEALAKDLRGTQYINLTPSDGAWERCFMSMPPKVSGIAVVNNESHDEFLWQNLEKHIMKLQATQGHALHKSDETDSIKRLFASFFVEPTAQDEASDVELSDVEMDPGSSAIDD